MTQEGLSRTPAAMQRGGENSHHGQPEWRPLTGRLVRFAKIGSYAGKRSRRHRVEHPTRATTRRLSGSRRSTAGVGDSGYLRCQSAGGGEVVTVVYQSAAPGLPVGGSGARGVVLFNRFYQPDFDIETLEVRPTPALSKPSELLPRLHWAAILYGHVNLDIAITAAFTPPKTC